MLELKKGSIDFMALPTGLLPELLDENAQLKGEYNKQFAIKIVSGFNSHFLGINMQKIEDAHLRRALSLAVNRISISKNILRGLGTVNIGTIPLNYQGVLPKTVQFFSTDLFYSDQAREELKQSQYAGKEYRNFLRCSVCVQDCATTQLSCSADWYSYQAGQTGLRFSTFQDAQRGYRAFHLLCGLHV